MNKLIVAYDQNRGIGAGGDLLWQRDLPADLSHFRKLTLDKTVIMGRLTFESLGQKPLPRRQNILVSRRSVDQSNVTWASSLSDAFSKSQYEPFVIGGSSIYEQAIDSVDEIYATEVQAGFPAADRFFPELGPDWLEVSRQSQSADQNNRYGFDFVTFRRR